MRELYLAPAKSASWPNAPGKDWKGSCWTCLKYVCSNSLSRNNGQTLPNFVLRFNESQEWEQAVTRLFLSSAASGMTAGRPPHSFYLPTGSPTFPPVSAPAVGWESHCLCWLSSGCDAGLGVLHPFYFFTQIPKFQGKWGAKMNLFLLVGVLQSSLESRYPGQRPWSGGGATPAADTGVLLPFSKTTEWSRTKIHKPQAPVW